MGYWEYFTGQQTWADHVNNREMVKGFEKALAKSAGNKLQIDLGPSNYQISNEMGLGALTSLAGQEALSNTVEFEVDRLVSGIDRLNADFNLLLGDVIWKLESQHGTLNNILQEIRLAEFEREARAYRESGEDAYNNGWYDDALREFLEAEKRNFKDFAVQRSIANIYLYHLKDLPRSLEYFCKAAKYTKPRDARQSAEAEYFAGVVCGMQQKFSEALAHISAAVELNPVFYEAYYLQACLASILGDAHTAVKGLREAISGDFRYYERAVKDIMFDRMRSVITNFLGEVKGRKRREARGSMDELKRVINTAAQVGAGNNLIPCTDALNDMEGKFSRDNAFVYHQLTYESQKWQERGFRIADEAMREKVNGKRIAIDNLTKEKDQRVRDVISKIHEIDTKLDKQRYDARNSSFEPVKIGCLVYAALGILFFLVVGSYVGSIDARLTPQDRMFWIPFIAIGTPVFPLVAGALIHMFHKMAHSANKALYESEMRKKQNSAAIQKDEIMAERSKIEAKYRERLAEHELEMESLNNMLNRLQRNQHV